MKLASTMIERTLDQFEAEPLAETIRQFRS